MRFCDFSPVNYNLNAVIRCIRNYTLLKLQFSKETQILRYVLNVTYISIHVSSKMSLFINLTIHIVSLFSLFLYARLPTLYRIMCNLHMYIKMCILYNKINKMVMCHLSHL